jgi:purine-nucleoside phosphorylase
MATPHIGASTGEIAEVVLMPGDPRRGKRIAHAVLDDARLVTDVRGMEGYTGTCNGTPMSVLASGMGIPSIIIYATELYRYFGVKRIVRVGTAGALPERVAVRDVVIASAAHTDSSVSRLAVAGVTLSLAPSYPLLRSAADFAQRHAPEVHVGPVLTSDHFYLERGQVLDALEARGTLAVEMEAAGLYAAAAAEGGEALAIMTISDHIRTGLSLSADERESFFDRMVEIGCAALLD